MSKLNKFGRKRAFHKFDNKFKENLTTRQRLYLEANYGKGVYGSKKYNEVIQELKTIENGSIVDIDFLVAKRGFSGDRRKFNKIIPDPSKEIFTDESKANYEGEILNSYIPLTSEYSLAYLTVPGYNNSPISVVKIIPNNTIGDYRYE